MEVLLLIECRDWNEGYNSVSAQSCTRRPLDLGPRPAMSYPQRTLIPLLAQKCPWYVLPRQGVAFDTALGPCRWISNSLSFDRNYDASVFETTIRCVGGLLSAYDLSGEGVFLKKATDLAERLLPAFNTPTGIPLNTVNLQSGNAYNPGWTGMASTLADFGTEQLEFIGLSERTGDPKYRQLVRAFSA
jgi:hypothetical protein